MEEMSKKRNDITITKSEELKDIPLFCKNYRGITIKKRSGQIARWRKRSIERIREKYSCEDWRNNPIFSGYVDLHNQYSKEKDLPGSSQVMIDFILEKGSLPTINTFVDIYNVISACSGISMGAHDMDEIIGNPKLQVIDQDSNFRMIGFPADVTARKGEYCYTDDAGILCRLDIKQCERTKVTESTGNVLLIFQGNGNLPESELIKGCEMFDEAFNKFIQV